MIHEINFIRFNSTFVPSITLGISSSLYLLGVVQCILYHRNSFTNIHEFSTVNKKILSICAFLNLFNINIKTTEKWIEIFKCILFC